MLFTIITISRKREQTTHAHDGLFYLHVSFLLHCDTLKRQSVQARQPHTSISGCLSMTAGKASRRGANAHRVGLKTRRSATLSHDTRPRLLFIARDAGREGGRGWEFARCSSHENLHAMVAVVGHDHAPVAVDGDATEGVDELPVA